MKDVEKRVDKMLTPFRCQRCKRLMETGTLRTAVWEGEKNDLGEWVRVDNITFLCERCEPIDPRTRNRA